MGGSASRGVKSVDDIFVVKVIRCTDVPKVDTFSESDPCVRLEGIRNGKPVGVRTKNLHHNDSTNPDFRTYHDLEFKPISGDKLNVRIIDYDPLDYDDIIADIFVDIEKELNDEQEHEFKIPGYETTNPNFSVTLQRLYINAIPPTRKTFYIVRHGESKWNKAQANADIGSMLAYDHPLSKPGIEQCKALNAKWTSELANKDKNNKDGEESKAPANQSDAAYFVDKFLSADFCYCSPLTRAVQTALIVMNGHPCVKQHGLTFRRSIRERKNAGGMDTIGKECGDNIMIRVEKEFAADDYKDLFEQCKVKVDIGDTSTSWWSPINEKDDDTYMNERVSEMLDIARFGPHAIPVFVGHSLFFQHFYSQAMDPSFVKKCPELAAKMKKNKLDNATMMGIEMDWPLTGPPKIVRADVMYGGHFHETHGKGCCA